MRDIGIAGAAELIVMALGSNFVGATDHPGIFGRTIFAEFFEEFFKAGFQLADRAVALEAQRDIAGRRHVLVYARNGPRAKTLATLAGGQPRPAKKNKQDAFRGALLLEN